MIKPTEGNIEMKEQNGVLWGSSSLGNPHKQGKFMALRPLAFCQMLVNFNVSKLLSLMFFRSTSGGLSSSDL